MAKIWRIHPHDGDRIRAFQRSVPVPAIIAHLLLCRGVDTPEKAEIYLNPKLTELRDPSELPGCVDAAERIGAAVQAGRRIAIYGDYDVDGMTGTAILHQCLRRLGARVSYYVPHRVDEGYGLNHEAIRSLAADGVEMLVTVDCGITSVAEAETAKACGLELIISDHHRFQDELPAADALVHPALPGHDYPFDGLSGSAVAFKIAWALAQNANGGGRASESMRRFLVEAVGLAAMGTIADVVPLVDENRVLVRYGLEKSLPSHAPLGVQMLMDKALRRRPGESLSAEDVAFALGPRLNAVWRLCQARLGVELLVTDQPDRAKELADYVDGLNQTRQKLERSIQKEAVAQIKEHFDAEEDSALVVAGESWHPGVIGIVAGRLAEKFHRPVILIALDPLGNKPGVGSGRSVPGFNIHSALVHCDRWLERHGGHAAAAGLTILPENVDSFREAFCEYAATEIHQEQRQAELMIDAEFPLSTFTLQTVNQLEQMAPFGEANARPVICTTAADLVDAPQTMGAGGRHLSMKLRQHNVTFRAVAFGGGEWAETLADCGGQIDVAFRPVVNTFRGRRNVELHVIDWRPHCNGSGAEAEASPSTGRAGSA